MPKNDNTHVRQTRLAKLPITLQNLLKYENMVASGGEAKLVIREGWVNVNAERETRRGRKLYAGDVVTFNNEHVEVLAENE